MLVSVVTVSKRPSFLAQVIANYRRQTWPDKELVFVANTPEFDLESVIGSFSRIGPHKLIVRRTTIGGAMNEAIDASAGRIWAKFDDDDMYGPDYLREAVDAIQGKEAALVGKRTCYAYMAGTDTTIIRTPGREERWLNAVAGSTLAGHKERLAGFEFSSELTTGEDTRYMGDLVAGGTKIWSTSRRGFMLIRRADPLTHTWQIDDATFSRNSEFVANGRDLDAAGCR